MTSYIAHHTKKKQILARQEAALERLVDSGASARRLRESAEDVREARVRVLQAQRATIVPKGDADAQYAKIDDRIRTTRATPVAAILAEFGCELGSELGSNADLDG